METWTKTCGPIPGGLTLTHSHMGRSVFDGFVGLKGNQKEKGSRMSFLEWYPFSVGYQPAWGPQIMKTYIPWTSTTVF